MHLCPKINKKTAEMPWGSCQKEDDNKVYWCLEKIYNDRRFLSRRQSRRRVLAEERLDVTPRRWPWTRQYGVES